jgi:putative tryptophan/tyrosine transport system substrate-binding protein
MRGEARRLGVALGLVIGVLLTPPAGEGQPARRPYQVGYLGTSTPAGEAPLLEGFRQGLRELGYVEGQSVVIHYRWAEGSLQPMVRLATELARLPVDVIVTAGDAGGLSARKATATVPIVLAAAGDPQGSGLVSALARPGGNVTGMATLYPELEGKRLEVLREISPGIRRISVLMNPANPFTGPAWDRTRKAAASLHLAVVPAEARRVEDLEPALAAIAKARTDAMVVIGDRAVLLAHRAAILDFAARQRLPTMAIFREFAADGGLVSLGPDFVESFRRAAWYVDRILKGAKPGELPVERPSKVELVVNMRAARALGLAVPQSILLRASEVIDP